MKNKPRALQFGRMLNLCDDLQRIRSRISDPDTSSDERERLRRQTERRQGRLTRELAAYRGRGPLAQQLRRHRLDASEFEVLAVLLQRAVRAEAPEMEGRLILGSIFDTSFGVLSGLHLLQEDARLRTSGLVRTADDQPATADVLETRFRLSEQAMAAMHEEVAGRRAPRRRKQEVDGYRSQRELLLDLRVLHNHYARRSELLFEPTRWASLRTGDEMATGISARIDALWAQIRTRILRTEHQGDFPLLKLLREFRLGDPETIVIVHLLFRELHSGEAAADVAELLQLVSASEVELLRARRLVAADSPMVRGQILVLEPYVENRNLTAEARLDDWVVNQLLDDADAAKDIRSEERLRWHEYLDRMDGSDGFFRDLDA